MSFVRKMIIWTSVLLLLVLLNGTLVSSDELPSQSSSSMRRSDSSQPQPLHRFKSLERVLNRLDGVSSTVIPKSEEPNSGSFSYRRTAKWTESEPQDLASLDDDSLDDEDDDSYEEDNEMDFRSDKPAVMNFPSRHQISRAKTTVPTTTTTTTTTTTQAPPPVMSYSQYKWAHFGTRDGIDKYRSQSMPESRSSNQPPQRHHNHRNNNNNNNNSNGHHANNNNNHHNQHSTTTNHHSNNNHSGQSRAQPQSPDTSIREAINHALKVSREGGCKEAKPRLVRVQDFYPHPGKTYVPHCTILHQCSDDTGCCRHDVLTCSPKSTQRVELAFYTITVDSNRGSSVERLVFYNHTECECRDRLDEEMPRDISVPAAAQVTTSEGQTGGRQNSNLQPATTTTRMHNLLQCNCPSDYTERVLPDGSCTCDCFDKQKECLRLKKGRNFFTMQNKWCIQSGRCEVPSCAYGSYIHLVGRCPRKKERYGSSMTWHRYNTK